MVSLFLPAIARLPESTPHRIIQPLSQGAELLMSHERSAARKRIHPSTSRGRFEAGSHGFLRYPAHPLDEETASVTAEAVGVVVATDSQNITKVILRGGIQCHCCYTVTASGGPEVEHEIGAGGIHAVVGILATTDA